MAEASETLAFASIVPFDNKSVTDDNTSAELVALAITGVDIL